MKTVTLNASAMTDESSFHVEFQNVLGFPEFYGHNMSAWVDCIGFVDDPSAGMSTVSVAPGEMLVLRIENAGDFKRRCPGLWLTFLECAAFVNWRRMDRGGVAVVSVSAYA
jgi:hypothetical protein